MGSVRSRTYAHQHTPPNLKQQQTTWAETAAAPKAKKAAAKPKVAAAHPPYANMIGAAIKALKERNGSSRQAILKYIVANYKVGDAAKAQIRVRLALKKMAAAGAAGKKGAGCFKLAAAPKVEKKKPAAKKPKAKKAAKKPAAKKAAKAKKPAAKKAPKAKKPAAKKAAKKPAAKKPAKKAAKK